RSSDLSTPNRGSRQVRPEDPAIAFIPVALDPGDRVRLPYVPVRVRKGRDRPRVVQEGAGILHDRLETELVDDVLFAVSVVVDQDFIEDLIAELEEVRTACGFLQRDEVREERDLRRVRGIDE